MTPECLRIHRTPTYRAGRMILAFSGWMDGGDVSTGSVEWLVKALGAGPIGTIDSDRFAITNFPGSMEIAALFRPRVKYEEGRVVEYEPPESRFFAADDARLILFQGQEPNLGWGAFGEAIFSLAAATGVHELYFIGSFGGTVPHTREPRLFSAISDEGLRERLAPLGVRWTDYEGPASFSTHLLCHARQRGLSMATFVAEIPPYIDGVNPTCIEAVVRKLVGLLELKLDLAELRTLSTAWEERVNEALADRDDLRDEIARLEQDYDNEIFDTQMGDLKEWLEGKGLRVD